MRTLGKGGIFPKSTFRFDWGCIGFILTRLIIPEAAFQALFFPTLRAGASYGPSTTQRIERMPRGMTPEKIEKTPSADPTGFTALLGIPSLLVDMNRRRERNIVQSGLRDGGAS